MTEIKSKLIDFLDSEVPPGTDIPPHLPLTHISAAYFIDEIIELNKLIPSPCDTFSEDLLYFFYGKPAYRTKHQNNSALEYDWPIVFIFSPEQLPHARSIYPFDTGAFEKGLYSGFFHKNSKIEDFELPAAELKYAQKTTKVFYGNNKNYFTGCHRRDLKIPIRNFEAQGIYELARCADLRDHPGRRDERSVTIEIQYLENVSLIDSVLGMVVPQPYLGEDDFVEAISSWGVDFLEHYNPIQHIGCEAWVGQLYEKIQKIINESGGQLTS